jgi:glucokinase
VILAGDIGGTNARLALFAIEARRPRLVTEQTYPSRGHSSLYEIVDLFRADHRESVDQSCFGIPGPIHVGRSVATNLPWVVDSRELARRLGIAEVGLINDLEANAWGIHELGAGDFEVLQTGAPDAVGNSAVIAAGTGLGQAGLFWNGKAHLPFASEGGHASFSPADDLQIELLRHLQSKFGVVSWERVVSGPGLVNIYTFLRDTGRGVEPEWLRLAIAASDPPPIIYDAAIGHKSPLCEMALDLFCSLYGSEAGNLAVKMMATGGIYLGGGIAPKILPLLRQSAFLKSFLNKGRVRPVLEQMPVQVILNRSTALIGAARRAGAGVGLC